MGEIVRFKRPSPAQRHKGATLCRNGHHKWKLEKAARFDVKAGRLVTVFRCVRCGKARVKGL